MAGLNIPLSEGGDEGTHAGERILSVLVLLECIRSVTFVISTDKSVLVGHGDAMNSKPVYHANFITLQVLKPATN